jgi:hypothetical protein
VFRRPELFNQQTRVLELIVAVAPLSDMLDALARL